MTGTLRGKPDGGDGKETRYRGYLIPPLRITSFLALISWLSGAVLSLGFLLMVTLFTLFFFL